MIGRIQRRLAVTAAEMNRRRRGAATAEYALILALVAIGLIASLGGLRDALSDQLADIVTEIQAP